MKIENITKGMPVAYLPPHLPKNEIKDDQLGIVSSKNDTFVFVKYMHSETAQATRPEDLYPIHNRPYLQERLGIDVKPINRINEIYLEDKKNILPNDL